MRVTVYRTGEFDYIGYKDSKSPRPDKEWWITHDTYLRLTSTDDEYRLEGIARLIQEVLNNWEHDHEVVQRDNPSGVFKNPEWPDESKVKHFNCGQRWSHHAHYRETDGAWCAGRSYDQT